MDTSLARAAGGSRPAPAPVGTVLRPRLRDGASVSAPTDRQGHGRALQQQLRRIRDDAVRRHRTVVLTGLSLANAAEVADGLGAESLGVVTSVVAQRLLTLPHEVHLLAVSPLGGVVAAVVCERHERHAVGEETRTACSGFVDVVGMRVWPVVTVGLRPIAHASESTALALADMRQIVFDTDRRSPGGVRWHEPGTVSTPARRTLSLTNDLADAMVDPDEQLSLAFQPVRDLRTGRVTAVEALLRWQHPEHGMVPPPDAIGVAESSGLIHPLGAWVLDRALRQGSAWWRAHRYVTVHVNVSPVELREPSYAAGVARALRLHDLPPTALLLELTETDLMVGDSEVRATLDSLRSLGVRLGIDDFGTGWSSIGQLLDLPVDTVKVDRSLVSRIDHSPADLDLLRAVLGLLDTAPMEVVVEGVENLAQASVLRTLGVRLAQGYHLGRPVPAAELVLGGSGGPGGPGGAALRTAV
ncbi:MAG: EAL domain-containing protein [Nocardioides sp.]